MNTHVNRVQPRDSLARIDGLPLRNNPAMHQDPSTAPPTLLHNTAFCLDISALFPIPCPYLHYRTPPMSSLPLHHGECFAMLPAIAPGTYIAPSPHTPSSFGQPVTFSFTSPVRFVIIHFGYRCRLGCQARHWITRL